MFRSVFSRAFLLTLLFSIFVGYANAVPLVLSHQGRLLDASDAPISGTFTIIYSIHDAPVGGTQLWLEDHVGVVVTGGLFSVTLGSTVPLTADILAGSGGGGGGATRYLQVQIAGQPPISPRTPLVSSPYSVATSRVSGDIETFAGGFKTRCQGCNDPWRGDISAASVVGADSFTVVRLNGLPPGTPVTGRAGMAVTGDISSIWLGDIDADGQLDMHCGPDSTVFDIGANDAGLASSKFAVKIAKGSAMGRMSVTNTTGNTMEITEGCDAGSGSARVAIKTKGTGADANRVLIIQSQATPTDLSSSSTIDNNGDTVPESSISQSLTPTTCGVAINTKGTGAEKNRTAGSKCDDSSAVHYLDIDNDGDGNSEAKAVSSVSSHTGGPSSAAYAATGRLYTDSDDDGVPEGDITQSVTPTTCGVAIKVKGTGAENNRTAGSFCDDSMVVNYLDLDDDGDGISEGRGIISVKSGTGSGSMSPRIDNRLICDSDDDGIEDMSVSSSCDASQAKIVTDRDSGRSKARMSTTGTESSVAVEDDSDGDGLIERSVVCSVDPSQALVVVSEGDAEVSLTTRKGGVVNGNITIIQGPTLRVQLDGNGNGFLSNSLGIGVTATHPIDVAGGAYCDGTNWVNASDENSKENFQKVDGEELLDKISELEITQWNYKGDDDAQHIGPTAQDFKKTFGVGADDKSISTIDPSGIALAAIKELYVQLQAKDKEMKELREEMAKLKKEMAKKK